MGDSLWPSPGVLVSFACGMEVWGSSSPNVCPISANEAVGIYIFANFAIKYLYRYAKKFRN